MKQKHFLNIKYVIPARLITATVNQILQMERLIPLRIYAKSQMSNFWIYFQ